MGRKSSDNDRVVASSLPRKAFHLEWKNSAQKIAYMAFEQHDMLFLLGPAGSAKTHLAVAFACSEILGKKKKKFVMTRPLVEAGEKLGYLPGPQPLDAKILTPEGWKLMGDLKEGGEVIGRDGKPAKIVKIIPNGKKMVYRVATTENSCTEACIDHIWLTRTLEDRKRNKSGSIKSTRDILKTLLKNGKINHFLPRNDYVDFGKKNLRLSPYTLGILLGDGCITNTVGFGNLDAEIVQRVQEEISHLGCTVVKQESSINYNIRANLTCKKPPKKVKLSYDTGRVEEFSSLNKACIAKNINGGTLRHRCKYGLKIEGIRYEFLSLESRWSHPIKNILQELNLLGKKSFQKFIPDVYKLSSIEDRIDLLRGLMDTDGCVKNVSCDATYTTTSLRLAKDIIDLVKSLGGRAVLRSKTRSKTSLIDNRRILSRRKSYEFNISLPDINPFYISRKAKNYVPPKFMRQIGIKSIEPMHEKKVQCILLDNEDHLYITDQYIVTHNTFEEKINPFLMPIFDCLDTIVGRDTMERNKINHCMEIAPVAYLRGRTFHDSVVVLDEAQNATEEQLKLVMSRLGLNSKMVITGDPTQSDLKFEVALPKIVENMKKVQGIGVVEFNESHIVRHPLVADILAAWPK